MSDWFVGTTRRIAGQLIMRHYGYFEIVVSGRIVHADDIYELVREIKDVT